MSKRRQKHEEHEEHVNHERWLVTYADMITLLMVLFIVLFAIGQTDLKKYKTLRHSLAKGFGGPDKMALMDGGDGILEGGASPIGIVPQEVAAKGALDALGRRSTAWKIEKSKLEDTKATIEKSLKAGTPGQISDSQIRITIGSRGLIISINSDVVLFAPGSADLQETGRKILDRIAPQLVALPNTITVEGHTDNVPISGVYPSNWELSTARAASVLRLFIERDGLPAKRGSAAGFADQKQLASNATAEGRSKNRRVEIVVVATVNDPAVDTPDAADLIKMGQATTEDSSGDSAVATAPINTPAAVSTVPRTATPALFAAPSVAATPTAPLATTPNLPTEPTPTAPTAPSAPTGLSSADTFSIAPRLVVSPRSVSPTNSTAPQGS